MNPGLCAVDSVDIKLVMEVVDCKVVVVLDAKDEFTGGDLALCLLGDAAREEL
jgi:hypothetical protein